MYYVTKTVRGKDQQRVHFPAKPNQFHHNEHDKVHVIELNSKVIPIYIVQIVLKLIASAASNVGLCLSRSPVSF